MFLHFFLQTSAIVLKFDVIHILVRISVEKLAFLWKGGGVQRPPRKKVFKKLILIQFLLSIL